MPEAFLQQAFFIFFELGKALYFKLIFISRKCRHIQELPFLHQPGSFH